MINTASCGLSGIHCLLFKIQTEHQGNILQAVCRIPVHMTRSWNVNMNIPSMKLKSNAWLLLVFCVTALKSGMLQSLYVEVEYIVSACTSAMSGMPA